MSAITKPNNEQEIADFVLAAKNNGKSLEIFGGSTRNGLGNIVKADTKISLKKHTGVTLYEPEALTLVVKAGTTLKDIHKLLGKHGQQLPFEPMCHKSLFGTNGDTTIGAIVACNISGPRRIQAGACRDSLMGVRFINGRGEIIKNGGRVMKNVTGLDLVKLVCGSHGTLGILSELSFKVLPIAERQATLAVHNLSVAEAISTLSAALSSPFDITGAAHLPEYIGKPITMMRIEGFSNQVDYRLSSLASALGGNHKSNVIEGAQHDELWQSVRDVTSFSNSSDAVWRISTTPGNAPELYKLINQQFKAKFVFDWGGGLIWVSIDQNAGAPPCDIRPLLQVFGGHAMLVRASDELRRQVPVFHPQSKPITALSNAIRTKFDPAGILNPGRMTGTRD